MAKDLENNNEQKKIKRDKIVIRTSIIGIITNFLLAIFKLVIGLISNSIAIILDAINNITDAGGSVITIVGTKLAAKEPDKKHPFGYGRIEYLSAMNISAIIMAAGVTSLIESIKTIISGSEPNYSTTSIVIIIVAVITKFSLGIYFKKVGKSVNSDSLVSTGADSQMDAIISAATVVAALIFVFTKVSIEAYLAGVISLLIIKTGFTMLLETISKILGERAEIELFKNIKNDIRAVEDVNGVYDLVLNNYGPDTYTGSVHIGIHNDYTIEKLDDLIKKITDLIYNKYNVYLNGISAYAVDLDDKHANKVREEVSKICFQHKYVLEVHAFRMNREKKTMNFDVVVSLDSRNRKQIVDKIKKDVLAKYPDYDISIVLDTDFAEY